MRRAGAILLTLGVAGCMTPARMYTTDELTRVGQACGLALGELAQEEEEPRLLFMIVPSPSAQQFQCVRRWARRRNLHLVSLDGVERTTYVPIE